MPTTGKTLGSQPSELRDLRAKTSPRIAITFETSWLRSQENLLYKCLKRVKYSCCHVTGSIVPPHIRILESYPAGSQNVTLFGERVFISVIKLKLDH